MFLKFMAWIGLFCLTTLKSCQCLSSKAEDPEARKLLDKLSEVRFVRLDSRQNENDRSSENDSFIDVEV